MYYFHLKVMVRLSFLDVSNTLKLVFPLQVPKSKSTKVEVRLSIWDEGSINQKWIELLLARVKFWTSKSLSYQIKGPCSMDLASAKGRYRLMYMYMSCSVADSMFLELFDVVLLPKELLVLILKSFSPTCECVNWSHFFFDNSIFLLKIYCNFHLLVVG